MLPRLTIAPLPPECFADAAAGPSAAVWAGRARRALLQEGRLEALVLAGQRLNRPKVAQAAWYVLSSARTLGPEGLNRADVGVWIQVALHLLDPATPDARHAHILASLGSGQRGSPDDSLAQEARAIANGTGRRSPSVDIDSMVARARVPGLEHTACIDAAALPACETNLAQAQRALVSALPWARSELDRLVQRIVPVVAERGRLVSATNSELLGAVFVTMHDDPLLVGEQLVHELSHTRLFCVQMLDDLLLEATPNDSWTDARYYSPWRRDPRPLNGVLHGVFVFGAVAEYWRCHLERSETARRRFGLVVGQLLAAHDALTRHARFTDAGHALRLALQARMVETFYPVFATERLDHVHALDIEAIESREEIPVVSYLAAHHQRWSQENVHVCD